MLVESPLLCSLYWPQKQIGPIVTWVSSYQKRKCIAARGHIRSMDGGEVLYEQGYSAPPFFVVISGELEVVRPSVPVETM
jgi:hypothetical protein